jgi:hypothetical protein
MTPRTTDSLCVLLFGALLVAPRAANAAEPTTMECLAASENSLTLSSQHKLRAERAQLLICSAVSCPVEVRKECLSRVDAANAAIPALVFEAKDGAGKDLSAVKVTMDGELLAERLDGTALLVDPGEHVFSFESAGSPVLEKRLIIRESQKDRREVIVIGEQPATSKKKPDEATLLKPLQDTTAPPVVERPTLSTQRIIALVAGGVGVVGVGFGSYFGVRAMSKKKTAEDACPGTCTDDHGVELWSQAKTAGNISTVAFIVGGVGLAAGITLWVTDKPSAPRAQVGLGLGSIALKGAF